MLGIVANAGSIDRNITFVANSRSTSTTTTLNLASFQNGDYAFIFQTNLATSTIPNTPTGFTSIVSQGANLAGGGSMAIKISYKKMLTGDSTNITLSGSTILATSMLFRPDFNGTLEDYGSPSTQIVATQPSNQTITGLSTSLYPYIAFAHYTSTGAVSPRSSSVTMTEVNGPSTSQYVKYKIYNTNSTLENITGIGGFDGGAGNGLQSFAFQIQA